MHQCKFIAAYLSLSLLLVSADCQNISQEVHSVTLTVEGGVSLVGEHCPGTVRLFCEGVNLSFLRWRYDAGFGPVTINPVFYPSDESPFVAPAQFNKAFLTIQVVNISQGINNSTAYFSTILTADLVQLAQQNITGITCGQLGDRTDSVAVGISIQRSSFLTLWTLNITNVVATYQSGRLDSVEVHWTKLELNCDVYNTSVVYRLSTNGSKSVTVNHTSCGEMVCTATATGINLSQSHYEFTVRAYINGTFDPFEIQNSIRIEKKSQSYFKSTLNVTSCYISFVCEPVMDFDNNTNCSVQYTASSTQSDQNTIVALINKTTEFPPVKNIELLYNFTFSVAVNEQLVIKEKIQRSLQQSMHADTTPTKPEAIVIMCISSMFIILSLVHIALVILTKVLKIAPVQKGKPCFIAMVTLLSMDVFCTLFLILSGLSINDDCSQSPLASQFNIVLYIMIVIACLGIALLLCIWILWCRQVSQHKKAQITTSATEEIERDEGARKNSIQQKEILKSNSISEKNIYDANFFDESEVNDIYEDVLDSAEGDSFNNNCRPDQGEEKSLVDVLSLIEDSSNCIPDPDGNIYEYVPDSAEEDSSNCRPDQGEETNIVYDDVLSLVDAKEDSSRFPRPHLDDIIYEDALDSAEEDCSSNCRPALSIGSDESEQQYDQLCPWEKSQPVPDTDDPTYSHIHREDMDNTVEQLPNKL